MISLIRWVQPVNGYSWWLAASRLVVEPKAQKHQSKSPIGCQSNRRYDSIPWRKKTTLKLVPYDNLANYPWGAGANTPKVGNAGSGEAVSWAGESGRMGTTSWTKTDVKKLRKLHKFYD